MSAPSARLSRFTGFKPLPRSGLTERALARLEDGDLFAIAPPGYGKSTLLESVRAALSDAKNLYVLPQAGRFDAQGAESAEIVLIDRADAAGWTARQAIADWLRAPGRRAKVLLAARQGTGLPAAQLVSEGRATIWRAGELAFTVSEIAEFLSARGLSEAPEKTAATLFQQTEGWPLATALLAQEAAAHPGRTRMPANLPPALREVFDDLLANLPENVSADALALAALPDQIHAGLYQALTGAATFTALRTAGLDLQEVAGAPGWWRFARLFRQYLRERAQGTGRTHIANCHRRIAEWYLAEGHLPDAALHALETDDRPFALATIDRAARQFIAYGEIAHALTWLDHLEPADRLAHGEMWLHTVTALALSGAVDRARTEIAHLRNFLTDLSGADTQPDWYDEVRLNLECNAQIAALFDPDADPDPAALDALIADPEAPHYAVHGEAQTVKGLALLETGHLDEGRELLAHCGPALRKSRSWYGLAMAEAALARLEARAGGIGQACERCEAAEAEIIEALGFAAPCILPLALTRGELLIQTGDFTPAEDLLTAHAQNIQMLMNPALLARSHMLWGQIHLARGRPAEARAEARLGIDVLRERKAPAVRAGLRIVDTIAALRLGQTTDAREAVGPGFGLAPPARISASAGDLARLTEAGLAAAVLAAEGQNTRAARQFAAALRLAEAAGEVHFARELELLRLETSAADTEPTKTKRALKAWHDRVLASGLAGLAKRALAGPLGQHLPSGGAIRAVAPARDMGTAGAGHIVLTQKEEEVLSLIALGYTNRQIAEETVTALTTVKWHVRNIFEKLDVHTRTAALARAKDLGISAAG